MIIKLKLITVFNITSSTTRPLIRIRHPMNAQHAHAKVSFNRRVCAVTIMVRKNHWKNQTPSININSSISLLPLLHKQNYYKNAPFVAINRVDETHAHYTLPVWLYTRISACTSIYSLPVIHDASSIETIYARWWVLLRARALRQCGRPRFRPFCPPEIPVEFVCVFSYIMDIYLFYVTMWQQALDSCSDAYAALQRVRWLLFAAAMRLAWYDDGFPTLSCGVFERF